MAFFSENEIGFEPMILDDKVLDNGLRYVRAIPQGGVCSQVVEVAVKDGIIEGVQFIGGCSGNTQGVAALIKGFTLEEAVSRIIGISCGGRPTSCPDQLAKVLKYIMNNNKA